MKIKRTRPDCSTKVKIRYGCGHIEESFYGVAKQAKRDKVDAEHELCSNCKFEVSMKNSTFNRM